MQKQSRQRMKERYTFRLGSELVLLNALAQQRKCKPAVILRQLVRQAAQEQRITLSLPSSGGETEAQANAVLA